MSLPRSVAGVLRQHVTREVECIDRMYLNALTLSDAWNTHGHELCPIKCGTRRLPALTQVRQ
jgi:hypothetical protein